MSDNQKFDQLLDILTSFIAKQEAFNVKQEAFNAKQEWTNIRLEVGIDGVRRDLAEFRHQEELQHNATHRLIMQSFDHIAELKWEYDKKPWEK